VFIYALETDGLIWYVGRTKNIISRKSNHKTRRHKGIGADLIPIEYDFQFKILEECENDIGRMRERHWYDLLKPFNNKCVPGRNRDEAHKLYLANNRDNYLKQKREYYKIHREEIREKQKLYKAKLRAS
jgi:hypothetical protein